MVELYVREDSRDRLSSFLATGHAGWADSGEDVVCAAVSAVLQAAWLGLAEVAKVPVVGKRDRATGLLELSWAEEARDRADVHAILATAILSVERIAMEYPEAVHVIRERSDG